MKVLRSAFLLFMVCVSWCAGGELAKHDAIVLRCDPHVATGIVSAVRATIESQLGLPSRVVITNEGVATAADVVAVAAKSASPTGEIVVILTSSTISTNFTSAVFRPQRVVVARAVDNGAMAGVDRPGAGPSLRTIQRKVVQGVGLIAGMNPCPNPVCAMCLSSQRAIGFCPPCTSAFRKDLAAMGYKHRYDRLMEEALEKGGGTTNRNLSIPGVALPAGAKAEPAR